MLLSASFLSNVLVKVTTQDCCIVRLLSSEEQSRSASLDAGLDSAELISQLRAAHAEEDTRMGVDVVLGKAGDMSELGIYECYRVSLHFSV